MTVSQTLSTVVGTRVTRRHREFGETREYIDEALSVVPQALGISHTRDTLVGNEFVRGVSGGERKRVSLGEVMAAQVSLNMLSLIKIHAYEKPGSNHVLGQRDPWS